MKPSDVNFDFHMHTNFTDGMSGVNEMIRAANENGLDKIAITEHVRANSSWITKYVDAVKRARKTSACAVALGFETKLLDMNGAIDISKDAERRAELIICSLHRIPGLHEMNGNLAISKLDVARTKEVYIQAIKAICKNKSVDIIGHPFDLLQRFNIPMPGVEEMQGIAKAIGASGKVVEINTNYKVPSVEFIRICRSYGVKFSIGSDAHDISRVGDISRAVEALKQAGGSKKDIMEMCYI